MPPLKSHASKLRRIRLELAREPGHPHGDHAFGYSFVAPLNETGRIDATAWRANREACRVVRFRPNADQEIGHLVHTGTSWAFRYDVDGTDEDEQGYRFGDEQFRPGEYVSIKSEDGMHTYKVVTVEPA